MDGLRINGITLYLGKLPDRKQECFYFEEGAVITPVAYIREELLEDTQRLWSKMLGEEAAE